jgi:hypothetical protein
MLKLRDDARIVIRTRDDVRAIISLRDSVQNAQKAGTKERCARDERWGGAGEIHGRYQVWQSRHFSTYQELFVDSPQTERRPHDVPCRRWPHCCC